MANERRKKQLSHNQKTPQGPFGNVADIRSAWENLKTEKQLIMHFSNLAFTKEWQEEKSI